MLVAERDVVVHVVDDRLDARSRAAMSPNSDQASGAELIGLAVAAAEQVAHDLVGQLLDRHFVRVRRDLVGQAGVLDHEVGRSFSTPAGATRARAGLAELVDETPTSGSSGSLVISCPESAGHASARRVNAQ